MRLSLRTMIELLRTRRGPTTRALDVIFTPPYPESDPGFEMVKENGALNTPLAQWGIDLMFNAGATLAEVLHINSWPNEVKEDLRRDVLAPAVLNGDKVRFFWEPSGASGATFQKIEAGAEGGVDVVLRTPFAKISQTAVNEFNVDPQ